MALTSFATRSSDMPLNKPFSTFPVEFGDWKGKTSRFDDNVYEILGVEDSFLADYRDGKGDNVQLYIGYYQSQREGDLIHSPKNCMPGSGWNVTEAGIEEVDVAGKEAPVKVVKLILEKGTYKLVSLYWFQSRGRIISSEYMQKIYLVIDAVFRNRTDGSFVRLISSASDNNEEAALASLKKFTSDVFPILEEYIPE